MGQERPGAGLLVRAFGIEFAMSILERHGEIAIDGDAALRTTSRHAISIDGLVRQPKHDHGNENREQGTLAQLAKKPASG
jgi:hypothetical protein